MGSAPPMARSRRATVMWQKPSWRTSVRRPYAWRRQCPRREITAPRQEETLTGGLGLGAIEPVSNSILLEQPAAARDHATWHALMVDALAWRKGTVIQSTSDEAPCSLANVDEHLRAHHAPDLCHVQHELRKARAVPMAAKQRAAHQAVAQAEETLQRVPAPLDNADGASDKRGPGRPPKAPPCLEQGGQDVAAARREPSASRSSVSRCPRACAPWGMLTTVSTWSEVCVALASALPGISKPGSIPSALLPRRQTSATRASIVSRTPSGWCPKCRRLARASRARRASRANTWSGHRRRPLPCRRISSVVRS